MIVIIVIFRSVYAQSDVNKYEVPKTLCNATKIKKCLCRNKTVVKAIDVSEKMYVKW